MAIVVTSQDFAQQVLQAPQTVVVDFFATWCPPCQRLAPVFDALSAELPTLKLVKVNVDDAHDLAVQYGISSIPTLVVFKAGKVVAKELPRGFDVATLKAQFSQYI